MSKERDRWEETKNLHGSETMELGPYYTYQLKHTPRRTLFSMSYHKFAAKLIGEKKKILEVGCGEALASVMLFEFATQYVGVDVDADAIRVASRNFGGPGRSFVTGDFVANTALAGISGETFDAVACFDVIEHIFPENDPLFVSKLAEKLAPNGILIIGTPNITSAQYASKITASGHVNLYSADRMMASLQKHCRNTVVFSANDEVVHTGYHPMAHYLIGIGMGRSS